MRYVKTHMNVKKDQESIAYSVRRHDGRKERSLSVIRLTLYHHLDPQPRSAASYIVQDSEATTSDIFL